MPRIHVQPDGWTPFRWQVERRKSLSEEEAHPVCEPWSQFGCKKLHDRAMKPLCLHSDFFRLKQNFNQMQSGAWHWWFLVWKTAKMSRVQQITTGWWCSCRKEPWSGKSFSLLFRRQPHVETDFDELCPRCWPNFPKFLTAYFGGVWFGLSANITALMRSSTQTGFDVLIQEPSFKKQLEHRALCWDWWIEAGRALTNILHAEWLQKPLACNLPHQTLFLYKTQWRCVVRRTVQHGM